VVKNGSTVQTKVLLYACGANVTKTASVVAKVAATYTTSGGATTSKTFATCTDAPTRAGS
jgi:hypothetical protein